MKLVNKLVITIVLGSLSINALAVDYSTLNLKNFQFFRYPNEAAGTQQQVQYEPNIIQNGANHVKAMYNYFKDVLVGNSWLKTEQTQIFDPDTGKRNAHLFYKQFGYRGQNLIEMLGRGYTRDQLVHYGAMDNNFGRY